MSDEKNVAAALTGAARAIAAGLNAGYSEEQLKRGLSTRVVHELIADVVAVANAKIKELSARIEAIEAGGIKYCGIFQRAVTYRKGSVCTADGAMWIALRDTSEGEQPGKAIDAWQLAEKIRVKAGSRKL